MAPSFIDIAGRKVGPGKPCFIIAEAGVNHNGSVELALKMIDAAKTAGVDAIKFQTYRAERIVTGSAPLAEYQKQATGIDQSQLHMLKRLELSSEVHRELQEYCRQRDLLFLSTPFDEISADFLEELGMRAFKIPSGEITNLPFLEYVARKGTPMIISTGMSKLSEVEAAVAAVRQAGDTEFVLLHCVSAYPADPTQVNLRAMLTLAEAFDVPVGYSDHTLGDEIAFAATALGACVIEKHFTLDRNLPGPDHKASLEPEGMTALVHGIRTVEGALGHGRKEPAPCEIDAAMVSRKSIVSAHHITEGTILTEELIAFRRPGTGLPPPKLSLLLGRKAIRDIPPGTLLTLEMLA